VVAPASAMLSNFRSCSAFLHPASVRERRFCSSFTSKSSPGLNSLASRAKSRYWRAVSAVGPEMMSGVRASSIKMLSISSTIA